MYSTSTSRNFLKTILCLGILSLGHLNFAADYYWVGGSGVWTDLSHWATSSGGSTSHTIVPSPLDRVIFDANSFTADGQTVAVNFEVFCDRLEASNLGFQVNFDFNSGFNASSGIDISGDIDWTQSGNLTIGAGGLNIGSDASLTSNGTNNITGGITIQANANLTHNGLMTLDGDFELVSDNSYIQNSGETNVSNGNVILGNNALYHSKGGYWMRIYDGNLQMVSGAEFRKDRGYIDFRVGDLVIPGGAIFNTGSGQRWIRNGGFIAEANSTITVNGDFMVLYDGSLDLDPAANILTWNTSNIYFRATQFGQHTIRSSGINLRRLQFDDTNRNAEYSLLDDLTALNDGVFLYSNKFISNGFHIQAYHFYCWTTGVVAIDLTGTDSVNVSSQFRLYPSTNTTLTWDTPHIIWESTDHQYLYAGTNNSFDTLEFRSNNTGDRLIQIQYSTTVKNVKVNAKGEQRMNLLNGSTYGKFVWEYEKSTINTPDLYMQGGNTFQDTFSIRSSGTMRPKLRTHGNNTFGVFDIGDRVKEWEIQAGTVQTTSEITPLTGTCERTTLITSNTLGSVGKISQASGTVSGDYLQLQDNDVSGGATFNAINTADLGNVSGWNITAIPGQDFYWVGNNGNWSDPMNWSLSSGGAPYCAIPSRIDNVIFDANSFTASNQFASVDVPAECNDMSWNGIVTGAGLSNNQLLEIYGSLKLDANMNFAYSGRMDFQAIDINNTVETAGKVVREMRFEGQGQSTGVWTLVDDLNSSNWVYINRGTFNSDGNNITAYSISTSNSTVNFTNGTTQIQVQHRFEPNGTTVLDMGIADVLFEANNQHMYFRYANGHTFNDVTFNQNSTAGYQIIIEQNQNTTFKNWEINQNGSSWVRWDNNLNNDYDTVIVNQLNRGFTRFANTRQDTFGVFQMLHTGTANYAPRFEIHSNSHSLQFDKFEYFGENDIIPYFWADRGFSADTFTTRNLSYIRLHPSYTYNFDTLGIQGSCLQRTLLYSRTGGSQVTLDVASSAHIDFGLIKDMNATGTGTYTSGNTIDGGNVSGWPVGSGVNLYWVGGTGNWNDPNHWSLTSGGAPAGCMPSQGDNVFFDVNSFTAAGQTVNINVTASCHNMIWNNVNSPSLIGGSTLNIHGSLRLAPNLTWNHSGWTYFQSRNTGNTITTNGVQMRQIQFLGDGVYTGEWTLQDDLDVRYDLYTTYGSFVSGGHRVSCRSFFSNNNNVNTSVDFTGTDLISVRHRFELHNNPVFNIGMANIQWQNMEGGYYRFYGYGKTFNDLLFEHDDGANRIELHHNNNVQNLVINSTAYPTVSINGNSSYNDVNMVFNNNTTFIPQVTFTGTNNINVLSITSLGNGGPYINLNNNNTFNDLVAAGLGTRLLLGASRTQTVNGLLALGNGSFPVFVKSQTDGSQATIYMPEGEVCLDFILLQDIIGDGDPDGNGGIKTSFFAGNSSVDLGNNTNWQFSSCFAYYWVGDSGNWSDFANHWATSSGGTTFHSTVPGPTDNVYFDANSFTTNNQSVTVDVANAETHNMTWQSALFTPTLTGNTQINIYGDLELISNMNQDFTGNWNFRAADNGNILNSAAKTMGTLNFYGGNDGEGEWILQNTLSATGDINLDNGTLITNDKAISATNFNSSTASTRSLQLGASTITIKDGDWNPTTLSDATLDEGTSTIIISGTNTAGFLGNGLTYHDVTFTTTSNLSADLSGANTFKTLRIEPGLILTVEPVVQTMTALEANASCDNLITIQSSVAGTPATFSQASGTVDASFLNLKDNTATGGATFNANFSNDNGGNTAWTFSDPPQLLVTTGSGAVDCVTNNDGFAEVSGISGGTPPYTYLWSTSETTDRIENLIPGSYTVVISDASGCSVTEQIEVVNEPANITATSFIASDTEICLGQTIQFTAGTPPESVTSYLWDFGDFSSSTEQNPSHTFGAGGTYTVSLSYLDGNGCPAIVSQDITVSDLQVTVASNNIACFGTNDGSISITASGGAKPIQYSIDNGANYFTDGDFIGLSPGTYQVIVKDAFDCTTNVQTINLTEPASSLNFSVAITPISCNDATDGAIAISASGGTPPYDYSINNGIAYLSSPTFSDLGFGSYNVVVRDDNNCLATVQVSNIVVEDNNFPSITCPNDVSVTALVGDCDAAISVGSPSTDDDCGVDNVSNDFNGSTDASGTYPSGTTIVTWTVTDVNNNATQCSMNITVTESTNPTIICAAAITVNNDPGQCNASVTVAAPTYEDNCSVPPALSLSNDFNNTADASDTYPVGLTPVIWTTTDAAGNSASCTQNITVIDNEAPASPTLADVTGECEATASAPTTTDNCAGTITGTTTDPLTYTTQGTHIIEWTFDDGNGNVISVNQNVIVEDVTDPVTPTLADVTGECEATATAPIATDNCAGTITGTTTDPLTYTTQGTHTIEWKFDDGNGNVISVNQNVIVEDVTDPVTPTLADVTGECEATATAPTTTDNCAGTITGTTTDPLTYTTQGTHTIEWTFDDGNGNVISVNQNVIIEDVIDPATPILADITGECEATAVPPTTTDNCVGTITGTTTDPLTYTTQGTHTIEWTFDDGNGNVISVNQNVIIEDVTDPVISTLADLTGECVVTAIPPIATDNCAGTVTATTNGPTTFTTVGTEIITWTFDDGNGNVITATQNVTVTDTEPPTITCPADITVSTNGNSCQATVAYPLATALDNCSVEAFNFFNGGEPNDFGSGEDYLEMLTNGTWNDLPNSPSRQGIVEFNVLTSATFPGYTSLGQFGGHTYYYATSGTSWTVARANAQAIGGDLASMNSQEENDFINDQNVRGWVGGFHDQTAPDFVEPGNSSQNFGGWRWTDGTRLGSGQIDIVQTGGPASGSSFPLGDTPVTYTATDEAGLSSNCTFTITVEDNTPPVVPSLANVTGECEATATTPTTTDNCAGTITGTTTDPLTYTTQGTHTIQWTFDDGNGNVISVNQNVIIEDVTDPVIPTLADVIGECEATVAAPTTTDNCAGTITGTTTDLLTYTTQGTHTIEWTLDDGNGNVIFVNQNVIIEDVTAPVAPVLADVTGECEATATAPTTTDNCAGTITGTTTDPLTYNTQGTHTIEWTFDDGNGNVISVNQNVIIEDVTAPVAACTDITIDLIDRNTYSLTQANIDAIAAGTSDNCSGVTYAITAGTTDYDCDDRDAQFVVTLTATDIAGLTHSCTATVTIADPNSVCNDPPTAVCQDISIFTGTNCDASIVAADVDGGSTDPDLDPLDLVVDNDGPFGVGTHTVILTVSDGEFSDNCTATVTVEDNTLPIAICQDITVELDASGNATITAADIDNGSSDACGIESLVLDDYSFDCTDVGSDQASNNYSLDFDGIDDWVDATGNGGAKASAASLGLPTQAITLEVYAYVNTFGIWKSFVSFIQDNGGFERGWDLETRTNGKFGFTLNSVGGGGALTYMETTNSFNLGQWYHIAGTYDGTTMKIYVDGVLENTSIAENGDIWYADSWLALGVYKDDNEMNHLISGMDEVRIYDYAKTQAEIQATMSSTLSGTEAGLVAYYVFEDGPGSSTVTDLSGNGHDGILLNMDPATDWVGGSTATAGTGGGALVNLTVTDVNGLSSSCAANVSVLDNIAPVASCQDVSVLLDANGDATITVNDIDNGSSDACGIESLILDETSFDCADVGENEVMLIATDVNNNADTCYAIVTVEDKIVPIALCQDITIQLHAGTNNGDGSVSIVPGDINNGSNDACGIASLALDVTDFDCADVGANTVILTVTDSYDNVSTCTAEVRVEDKIGPVISSCPPDQVLVNTPGDCSTLASWAIPAISDNCDTAPTGVFTAPGVSIVLNAFGQFPVGSTTVTFTVTDVNDNETTCDFTVTVNDVEPPTLTSCPTNDIIVDNEAGLCEAEVDYGVLIASDNCAGVTFTADTNHDIDGDIFTVGTTLVSFTATDAVGLQTVCSFNVTVNDTELPIANCEDITIQLDAAGSATIIADDVFALASDNCAIDNNTLAVDQSSFDCSQVGTNTVEVSIDDIYGNTGTCTATVTVEDNVDPIALCQDITVQLDANGMGSISTNDIDNGSNDACGIQGLSLDITNFSCTDVGSNNTVTLTVLDNHNNSSTCTATITVEDKVAPLALCQDVTVQLDVMGDASITTADIDNGSNDACGIQSLNLNNNDFTCADVDNANTVILTVTDNNGNISSCQANVTVEDNIAPVASCQDVTIQLDPAGNASITASQIDNGSNDACGIDILSVTPSVFDCSDIGPNTVTLTVVDVNGNQSTCSSSVTVEDPVAPIAICQDLTVQLDATGNASITAAQVDNGSNDACGIGLLSLDIETFDCASVGLNTVTLTVVDNNDQSSTCTASITVEDNSIPVALCQDVTIQLDAAGVASITAAQVDNGSNDACGIASLALDITDFDCDNVNATNTVSLTAIDVNGNSNSCTATITVEDKVAPIALCQDVTVQLDASGTATITAAAVDNGSNDACGIASLSLDDTDFDCTDVGTKTVTLTATDVNDNTSTCTANITVEDKVAPIALCQDVTVQLDANGAGTLTAAAVDNGSSDACGVFQLSLDNTEFTCADIGIVNTVTLTVVDNHDNSSTCTANITVEDNVAPIALCQDVTLQLGVTGEAVLKPSQVDAGSNDACGIADIAIDITHFTCDAIATNNIVTLTATDINGNASTCTATISIEDNEAPDASCNAVTVQLDDTGNASITVTDIDGGSVDNCGIASRELDRTDFTCADIDALNFVTLTLTDVNGNVSTCGAGVIVQDNVDPVAQCEDIVVQLDATGQLTISPADVDGGSNDACGLTPLFLNETTFTCADIGDNTVSLTVTDDNGNESTCEATVTVEDNVLPIASCQNLVVQLDDSGITSITAAQIDNGSSDACGIANLSLDISDFDCSDVGANTVTLTVTDVTGNSSTCPAIVTVQDVNAPIAICQDISVQLDANGEATVSSSMVDAGSNDACGIADLSLDVSDFNCSDVGTNTISLTITDNNDNVSSCVANVIVEDLVAPVAICQDLTIQLDANGEATVEATTVNNGSTDACGIAAYNFLMGATELITNGGFDTDATGWTIDGVHVTYFNSGGNPGGWLWLNGVGNSGFDPSASQTVSGLTIGQSYTINGSTRNHANCCGAFVGQAALAIDIDGIEQSTVNNPGTTWTDFSYTFIASNTTHTIRFRSEINGHDTDMGIDNISISGMAMASASKIFDCSQVGSNIVTLQVTDNNANSSTCSANITVEDNIAPIALCQNITIQLDDNGVASINTADIDVGSNDACGIASLTLDHTDFNCTEVGANTVTLTVTDNNGNENTCSATVTVEDNVLPIALCQDATVQLDDNGVGSITTAAIDFGSNDACGIASLALDHTDFDCTEVGANTVTLIVTDNNGNENTCSATVTVEDNVLPIALCQDATVQLDGNGVGSISTAVIDFGSNDACGIASLTLDHTDFDCTEVGANTVTLTATDNNGNENTCSATVTVEDNIAPIALCQNITLQLDDSGVASINTAAIDAGSNDACGIASLALDQTAFDCTTVGTNTVTLTATDNNGNSHICVATVTVEDNIVPIVLCQDVDVQLDATGNGNITVGEVDAGSSDACGFASLVLDATTFSCTDIGANTVTLTGTDNNGNVSTCSATITVTDNVLPLAVCTDLSLSLNTAGEASITAGMIDNGSSDACGIASLSIDQVDFNCTQVGENTVTLTVLDNHGNASSCTATVEVQDLVAPIVLCQDLSIQLDQTGAANITTADVDNGSNDACGIASLSLDVTDFDCSQVGINTVTLTATDNNNNINTCTATVTVEDNVVPIALCQDISVQLTHLGQAFILPNMVDNGSTDACSLTYELDITSFDCSAVDAPATVELTVADPSGNTASCIATVTVEDNVAPVAICQDITIQLDAQGAADINAAVINAGSTDACGIAILSLDQTSFDCGQVGQNTVSLTVVDIHENASTCTAEVTVEDNIAPIASCKDVSITLDDTGLATLTTDDVAVTGPGFAQFVDSGQRLSRKRTEGLALADFDSDGDLDAFTANFRQGNRVWLNNGQAQFNSNGQNLGRFKSCGIDVGDLDGDGDVDAFVGNYGQGNRVWLNNGNARFWHNGQSLGNRRTLGLKLGDLDGDGDLDAFVANDGQANKVWINNGNGRFHWRGQYMSNSYSQDVDLGDLDGDGDLDAFVVNYRQGNRVWLNDGTGQFTRTNQSLGWFESKGIELGDLDGDGDLDAFVANEGRADRVWINNGGAHFVDGGQHMGYYQSTDVSLGSINGDASLDAFVTHYGQGNKVWLNNGNADFNHGGQYLGQNPSSGVKLGDLDGDGDLDAFVSNYGKPNWVWLNNYSSGIMDNCGIADISLSDEAFDCFDLGEHEVVVTVTDVNGNNSTCTATVTVLNQQGYDTADINHNGNPDDDCDGVADACDVCPGADDMLDSDNDGIPDCKDWEGFHNLPDDWKCGWSRRWGPTKVEICHVPYGNPDNAHTICVSERSVQSHLNHHGGDYLGPCFQITCDGDVATDDDDDDDDDDWDDLQRVTQPPHTLEEVQVFTDSTSTSRPLNIKLFPNPADHESFLDWRDHIGEKAIVRVFNQLGQLIQELKIEEINTPWLHLDLAKYNDGIYNVRVEIEGYEPTTRKLIVTKKGRTIKP